MIWVLVILRLTVDIPPPIVLVYPSQDECTAAITRVEEEMTKLDTDKRKYKVFCVEPLDQVLEKK